MASAEPRAPETVEDAGDRVGQTADCALDRPENASDASAASRFRGEGAGEPVRVARDDGGPGQ